MADYYPLIARAVSGLDKSTGEARRALYERARTALLAQLRGVAPALSEADITRERLALEEAIRRVEADAVRRPHVEAPRPETPPPARDQTRTEAQGPAPSFEGDGHETQHFESRESEPAQPEMPPKGLASGRRADKRSSGDRSSLMDQGLKGFRDGMAESASPGEVPQPSKSANDPFAAFPPPPRDPGRIEPGFKPDELLHTPRELPSPKPSEPRSGMAKPRTGPAQPRSHPEDFEQAPGERRLGSGFGGTARKVAIAGIVVVLAIAAVFAYREWTSIAGLYQLLRGPATQTAKDTTQTRPKIADRVGADSQQGPSSTRPSTGPAADVAQRVVLYEQQPDTEDRKQYIGSVIWRAESASPGPGLPPDLAIKADVEIPERHMRMSFTLRRNTDQTLPASHTIEILFSTPPDFPPGGVADMPGVLMEEAEQSRGAPLTGLRVKVTEGFFLIGLSTVESEARRNIQLLKERSWLHFPIFYKNNQRALLAIEKGVPGDRVFAEAFAAWQQ